jgi:gas vesicle protein
MNMSEQKNFGAFVMGFVIGSLSGAIASLLLAPQSGEETRQIIKDRAIELKDKSQETFEETKKKAEEAYKEILSKGMKKGEEALDTVEEEVRTTKKKVKKAAEELEEEND